MGWNGWRCVVFFYCSRFADDVEAEVEVEVEEEEEVTSGKKLFTHSVSVLSGENKHARSEALLKSSLQDSCCPKQQYHISRIITPDSKNFC